MMLSLADTLEHLDRQLRLFGMQGQLEAEQWINFTIQEVDAPMLSWLLPIIEFMVYN